MRIEKPMLAANWEPSKQKFPVLASPKLDGVRALCINNILVSRQLKPIRNRHTQQLFGCAMYEGFDGELVCGNFQETTSAVMSEEGTPDVHWFVFDCSSEAPFFERWLSLIETEKVHVIPHAWCFNLQEVLDYERICLAEGYEGIMLRDPAGRYKQGRSTVNEGLLLKVKRFKDAEAVIVGMEERKNHPDTLGALKVVASFGEFAIGSGFTEEQRFKFWREPLIGRTVKYKYQQHGVKKKPRFPVFVGFRDEDD